MRCSSASVLRCSAVACVCIFMMASWFSPILVRAPPSVSVRLVRLPAESELGHRAGGGEGQDAVASGAKVLLPRCRLLQRL